MTNGRPKYSNLYAPVPSDDRTVVRCAVPRALWLFYLITSISIIRTQTHAWERRCLMLFDKTDPKFRVELMRDRADARSGTA